MCFSPQRRAIFRHCNFEKCSENVVFCTFSLENVLLATAACNFSTSQLQKVVRSWHVLYIFTWKCASRHSGVQFFNISTSKSGPNLTCFVHFHLKMCFSPQRRAIFQHLNFKKWSGADVFCTFSLQNVLLATAACNFWFLLWPHDSAPAALTSLLFDSPDTRIIGKTQHFATSLTFGAGESSFFWLSRYCIFFLLTLLHLICFSSAFQLSILSEVYYLNFLRLSNYHSILYTVYTYQHPYQWTHTLFIIQNEIYKYKLMHGVFLRFRQPPAPHYAWGTKSESCWGFAWDISSTQKLESVRCQIGW